MEGRFAADNVIRLQSVIGNRSLLGVLRKVKPQTDSTTTNAVQREIVLKEIQITGDPQFYPCAQQQNQQLAANPPRPGWPYDKQLRKLWEQEAHDDFADAVRQYQATVMNREDAAANGILDLETASSLETTPLSLPAKLLTPGLVDETAANQPLGADSPLLAPAQAELEAVPQSLMNKATDPENPWAVHKEVYEQHMKSEGIGIEGAADTWEGFLQQMQAMTFLGQTVVGHTAFLKKLDIAQRYLRAQYPEVERNPGVQINVVGSRSQWRAGERSSSPHVFGMAIDLSGATNPWITNPQAPAKNMLYHWIMWRAVWLMQAGKLVTAADSHRRAGSRSPAGQEKAPAESTVEIWQHIHDTSEAIEKYLTLLDQPQSDGQNSALDTLLLKLGPPPPLPNLVEKGAKPAAVGAYIPEAIPIETLSRKIAAKDAWMAVIKHDRQHWPNIHENKKTGETSVRGIMDLKLELVVALRDIAGLQWGACDLGESQSGDMMHFALDPEPFFMFRDKVRKTLKTVGKKNKVTSKKQNTTNGAKERQK